jgi:hypothetical protein
LEKRERTPVFRWGNVKNQEKVQQISFFHGACAAGSEQKIVEISKPSQQRFRSFHSANGS